MRIALQAENGKKHMVKLIPRDVKLAKHLISDFLDSVKKHSEEQGVPTLLFTTLIMMHLMSQDQLKAITPDTVQKMLDSAYAGYEKHQEQNKTE